MVDDDALIRGSLSLSLGKTFALLSADDRPSALTRLREAPFPVHAALVDLGLPPSPHDPDEGLQLISDLLAQSPDLVILVLTGQGSDHLGRHARALGASDFLSKPCSPERLRDRLLEALDWRQPSAQSGNRLLGESPPIIRLRTHIRLYAASDFPVLIEGESGCGKEIIARSFHEESNRRGAPFLAVNCAALQPSLLESTLFGHAKGAYTGATGQRYGLFEEAGEGTLFLDEIGELPIDLQPKLLRVLENGEYQRIGETTSRHNRARIIAATNRDLREEARQGSFRSDLYHRLSVLTLQAPPLRELGQDIEALFEHFARRFSPTDQPPIELSTAAKNVLTRYPFPGNVRELRNIVIRLTARHPGETIDETLLGSELDTADRHPENGNDLLATARRRLQQDDRFNLDAHLRAHESAFIDAAMTLAHGNISQAARLLGLQRTTLYHRLDVLARQAPTLTPTDRYVP